MQMDAAQKGEESGVQGAAVTVPYTGHQSNGVLGEDTIKGNAAGGTCSATANAAVANSALNGASSAVSGAPVQGECAMEPVQHPDILHFNTAMWACLGDPNEALAAVGGG